MTSSDIEVVFVPCEIFCKHNSAVSQFKSLGISKIWSTKFLPLKLTEILGKELSLLSLCHKFNFLIPISWQPDDLLF